MLNNPIRRWSALAAAVALLLSPAAAYAHPKKMPISAAKAAIRAYAKKQDWGVLMLNECTQNGSSVDCNVAWGEADGSTCAEQATASYKMSSTSIVVRLQKSTLACTQ